MKTNRNHRAHELLGVDEKSTTNIDAINTLSKFADVEPENEKDYYSAPFMDSLGLATNIMTIPSKRQFRIKSLVRNKFVWQRLRKESFEEKKNNNQRTIERAN